MPRYITEQRILFIQKRVHYSVRILQMVVEITDFIDKMIMTDEAHFWMDGYINKQNWRFWGSENPMEVIERTSNPQKCTVWCGITSEAIIGPYFFEDTDGHQINVNGIRYRQMIREIVLPFIENKPDMWFQQDGATCHTANETMNLLRDNFGDRIISRRGNIEWPPRSPDLNAPDFFLWGYLKDCVYKRNPSSISDLKKIITEEIRSIKPSVLNRVMETAIERCRICQSGNGKHLNNVIFKR